MAARSLIEALALQRDMVIIAGSFAPNGGSAIDPLSRTGPGWSVARSNTGLYTVTLTDKYNALLSAQATLQLAVADDKFANIIAVNLAAKTIQIGVWDVSGAALTDVAANAGNRVNFVFMLSNTAQVPSRG